jgi:flagellar assembly protein FliH
MNAIKFTFDTVFAGEANVEADTARARKRHSLTEAELDAVRASARSEGVSAGEVRALEAIAAGAEDAAIAVREAMGRAMNEVDGLRAHSTALALAAARKLARSALASFPAEEVERCLREAMHQAFGEPRITLRVAPKVAEALKARIADIAHEEGFDGRVQLSPDPMIANADCRIEWRGGGAERTEATLEAAIDTLIARHFSDTAPIRPTED